MRLDLEEAAHVGEHLRRGGGGQRQHPFGMALLGKLSEPQVVGPKIVPPFRDAMGFIDGEQRDPRTLNGLAEAFVDEPFRGDVQQPQPARANVVHDGPIFVQRQRRIQPPGGDAPGGERVDLIFHQGDQWRHDERQTRQQQGGNLVAERLAAAGWEYGRRRSPGQQVPDRVLLARLELREAESVLEHLEQFAPSRFSAAVLVGLHETSSPIIRIRVGIDWRHF